ncbi:MAG: hypothetical protein ABUK11_03315 [Mariprofundaceae bacterium]
MKKLSIILTVLFSFTALSGCVVRHYGDHAPGSVATQINIPLTPSHGYRHHHHGITLVFDAFLGVYAVEGHSGIYFHGGRYFHRHSNGYWAYSSHFKGPWKKHISDGRLPHRFNSHMNKNQRLREVRKERREDVREDRRDNVRKKRE